MPLVMHGVVGMLVGGAGLFIADSVLKQVLDAIDSPQDAEESGDAQGGSRGVVYVEVTSSGE